MFKAKRPSYIDKLRGRDPGKNLTIPLNEGEELICQSQGVLKSNQHSGWQPGHLHLTNKRLVFKQVTKVKMDVALGDILKIEQQDGYFVGRKKKTIYLEVGSQNQRIMNLWILVEPPDIWLKQIREHTVQHY